MLCNFNCQQSTLFFSEKSLKEATRSWTTLVEQEQMKTQACDVSIEKLNKRIDNELKNMSKDLSKEDSKAIDESKFTARMERLGKEMSLMKGKQSDLAQSFDFAATKQLSLEEKNKSMSKILEKQQQEMLQLKIFEQDQKKLEERIDTHNKLYEKVMDECQKKIGRTEMDDVRNGMEKERCKINYFQDKISNIAKSVDGVKIENNNMRE